LILLIYFLSQFESQPVTMPPSPLPTVCQSIGGYDLTSAVSTSGKWTWDPATLRNISWSICDSINGQCSGSTNCGTIPNNCCGMCQSWPESGSEGGACLGKFVSATATSSGIQLTYDGGDIDTVTGVPRRGIINIACGGSGSSNPINPVKFIEPTSHGAGQPWIYVFETTSALLCGGIGGGGWILIILFVFLIPGYLIGGFLVNKFHFKNEGTVLELLPNYEFWIDTPHLFLEGCQFTKQKFLSLIGRE